MPVEDDNTIEHVGYLFTSVRDLVHADAQEQVDILAIVLDVGDIDSVVDRNGCVQIKRELKLADASNVQIVCTLWNEFAEVDYAEALYQPFAFQQAMVKDFRGRSLSTLSSTMIVPNPIVPEMQELQRWFDDTHGDISVPISMVDCHFITFKDVTLMANGTFVNVIGAIVRVDEPDEVSSMAGRPLTKRTVVLQDMSGVEMECTLWQEDIQNISTELVGHVVALENAKVAIYGECRIATNWKTSVLIDPAIPTCFELASWLKDCKPAGTTTLETPLEKYDVPDSETSPLGSNAASTGTLEGSTTQPFESPSSGQGSPSSMPNRLAQATPSPTAVVDPCTPSKNLGKRGRGAALKESMR